MKNQINLVSTKSGVKNELKKSFLISIILLGFVVILSIFTSAYNLILSNDLSNAQLEENSIKNKIAASPQKAKILLIQDRLQNIDKIIKSRKDINNKVISILEIIPESANIESVNISDKSLSIVLSSDNLSEYNLLLDKIYAFPKNYNNIKNVTMHSFDFNKKTGKYNLGLNFDFLK